MKRPAGLVLAAIVLGIFSAVGILFALLTLFSGVMMTHTPIASQPGAPQLSPGVMLGIFTAMALFLAGLAVWGILTIISLLRLRSWARYSILVMGGLLVFFAVPAVLVMAFLPSLLAQSAAVNPQAPAVPAGVMRGIQIATGLFYSSLGIVGAWWLTYFNLRSIKAYFLPRYANPYGIATAASLATPGGTPLAQPPPGRFAGVPTSIIVISCFLLFGAAGSLGCALLTFPTFLAGYTVSGWPEHLVYLALAAALGLIGWGLLRLDNRARLGLYGFIALGVINLAVVLTPWGRARYTLYNAQLYGNMFHSGMSRTPHPPPQLDHLMGGSALFGLIFYIVITWFIERHRNKFLLQTAALPPSNGF